MRKKLEPLNGWLLPFSEAWEMLLEVPLPGTAGRRNRNNGESDPAQVLYCFPLVGVAIAGFALLLAAFFSYVMAKPVFAIIFAVFFTVLLEFLTRGKSLCTISSFVENRFSGLSTYESFMELNEDLNAPRNPVGTIALIMIFIFKTFCVGILAWHGQVFWVLPALAAAYAVQAHLAVVESVRDSVPFVETDDAAVIKMWCLTAFVVLIFSICFKSVSAPVLLLIVSFLGASLFRKYCVEILEGVTGNIISFAGYFTEILLLLLGVLLLVRS